MKMGIIRKYNNIIQKKKLLEKNKNYCFYLFIFFNFKFF